ncbi:MAG: hypothetical protein ACKO90_07290 [Microcystis panniformis]
MNFCLEKAWQETGLTWSEIDGIAVTVAPGLVGALMVSRCCREAISGTTPP